MGKRNNQNNTPQPQKEKRPFVPASDPVGRRKQMAKIKKYYAEKHAEQIADAKDEEIVNVPLKKHGDQNGGHYHVIMDTFTHQGDEYHVSVGSTTEKKKGKNSTNYHCSKSILQNGRETYLRRQGTVDTVDKYSEKRRGIMIVKDYKVASQYATTAKQKFYQKKKK